MRTAGRKKFPQAKQINKMKKRKSMLHLNFAKCIYSDYFMFVYIYKFRVSRYNVN